MANFYYLYCLKNKTQRKFSLKGIDRREVYALSYKDIEAVTTEVSGMEFDPKKVKSKLERDLKWVEEKIRNHEAVVKEAMKDGPVIPLKFLTLYKSKTKLNNVLERHYKKFRRLLDELKGQAEWGAKIYLVDKDRLVEGIKKEEEEFIKMEEKLRSKPEGIKYFLEKKIKEKISEKVDEKLDGYLKDIFEILAPFSIKKPIINKLLPKELANRKGEMIFSASYLFPEEKLKEFQGVIKRLCDHYHPKGLWIECSGPWPPYSFVDHENKNKNSKPGI